MQPIWKDSTLSRALWVLGGETEFRGETLQDYTVGTGLVSTVAGVLAAVFGFLDALSAGVSGEDVSQYVSDGAVGNHSTANDQVDTRVLAVESSSGGEIAGPSARAVTFDGDAECNPSCRLVVRVW